MSLANNFNKKAVSRDRLDREIKTIEDFRSARIRHTDGSSGDYRAGKLVPGSFIPSKHIAKEDAPADSKFHTPTPVVTIVVEPEKEARVRKDFDVNAKALSL